MSEAKTFLLHLDVLKTVKKLPDVQLAALFRAIITTAEGDEAAPPEEEPARTLYEIIRVQMDADRERYKATCEKNRQNAKKRYQKQTE